MHQPSASSTPVPQYDANRNCRKTGAIPWVHAPNAGSHRMTPSQARALRLSPDIRSELTPREKAGRRRATDRDGAKSGAAFQGIVSHQPRQNRRRRKRFISRDDIESVLAEAPDAEWRAIIALTRYGGLRPPSETFALRWGDINWEGGTIRITCPKLAHRENHASRVVPLFPELRDPLLTLFAEAEPATE